MDPISYPDLHHLLVPHEKLSIYRHLAKISNRNILLRHQFELQSQYELEISHFSYVQQGTVETIVDRIGSISFISDDLTAVEIFPNKITC